MSLFQGCPYFRGVLILGVSLFLGVLISGVSLFQGFLYLLGVLISGVALFRVVLISWCPYFRDVLISGVSLFQWCHYFIKPWIMNLPYSVRQNVYVSFALNTDERATQVNGNETKTKRKKDA